MVFNAESADVPADSPAVRHDWTLDEVLDLFRLPFNDLLYRAQTVHRTHFDANAVQISTLLSIKTGGCPEDCAYCPQSAHYQTGVASDRLMAKEAVLAEARRAQAAGATRFCMGAAWRSPEDGDVENVAELVSGVKALGLETCATLGMLTRPQADRLKEAGLDFYNHNLDTSGVATTGRSSARGPIRIGSTHWRTSARPGCTSAAAASSGWARAGGPCRTAADAGEPARASRERADQPARARGGDAAGRRRAGRPARFRPDDRRGADPDAAVVRPPLGGPGGDERRNSRRFASSPGPNSIFYGEKLLTTPNPATHADRGSSTAWASGRLVPDRCRKGSIHRSDAPGTPTKHLAGFGTGTD